MAVFPFFSFCSALLALSLGIFIQFNAKQPKPYMDEIFHIPQAQKYCHYKFRDWDPKITTLPGMYFVSIVGLRVLSFLRGQTLHALCSTAFLRFTNIPFLLGNLCLLRQLLLRLHRPVDVKKAQRHKEEATKWFNEEFVTKCSATALVLIVFPVLYFFTFLYYTDSSSVFFVLLMYYLGLCGNHMSAALAGFVSVAIRQTNVIWVVFTAGVAALRTLEPIVDQSNSSNSLALLTDFKMFCGGFIKHFSKLLKRLWAYGAVVLVFGLFILWNGGIAVGDRTQHKACLNFPQLFYLLLFTLSFSCPLLLSPNDILGYLNIVKTLKKTFKFIGVLLIALLMIVLVYKFTYVHEYLLADNRHYPFYIWRKFFARHWSLKYAFVPLYMFAGFCIHSKLAARQHSLWVLMFYSCVAMVTVPQKLLEFRYFIIPYLIFRLHIPLVSYARLFMECFLYVCVNAITIYLFLKKPFQWAHDPEEVQRFMW